MQFRDEFYEIFRRTFSLLKRAFYRNIHSRNFNRITKLQNLAQLKVKREFVEFANLNDTSETHSETGSEVLLRED